MGEVPSVTELLPWLPSILVVIGFLIAGFRRKDDRIDAVVLGVARLQTMAEVTVREIGEMKALRAEDQRHRLDLRDRVAVLEAVVARLDERTRAA